MFETGQAVDIIVEYDSVNLILGEKFSSYDEFKENISAYVDGNNVQLVYNDSQTLEAA